MFYKLNLPWLNEKCGRGYASFFLGCVLASVWGRANQRTKLTLFSCASCWLLLCLTLGVLNPQFIDNQWGIATYAFFPSILIVAIFADEHMRAVGHQAGPAMDRMLQNFFYCLPFGMYVWHAPCLYLLRICRAHYLPFDPTYWHMAGFVLFMILWAIVSHRCIEQPLRRLTLRLAALHNNP